MGRIDPDAVTFHGSAASVGLGTGEGDAGTLDRPVRLRNEKLRLNALGLLALLKGLGCEPLSAEPERLVVWDGRPLGTCNADRLARPESNALGPRRVPNRAAERDFFPFVLLDPKPTVSLWRISWATSTISILVVGDRGLGACWFGAWYGVGIGRDVGRASRPSGGAEEGGRAPNGSCLANTFCWLSIS